ncbi:hypothetical protein Cs7R123_24290 [Catellatospora sp. TT07R-123]|uniref:hypothetical protein n=1 Tax=Catellatospora sp. TT07R-123 TaxID=2733863 RepID=UPI001B2F7B15|nr:hypothetical protein [Catellatospora sp. TT07R-123]GHJ45087.1 hypothetical protein Cs7R123_24290 [Catellatospora sp. TT07R-123]
MDGDTQGGDAREEPVRASLILDGLCTDWSGVVDEIELPDAVGGVADLVPVDARRGRGWLVLDASGRIGWCDRDFGAYRLLAKSSVPAPDDDEAPQHGFRPGRRLHADPRGRYAAVVLDGGSRGQVLDLAGGRVTMELSADDDNPETVPFSLAFAEHRGRPVVLHRTAWNRLDVSDPATGELLTARESPADGDSAHYLDYFHGALLVSPNGARVLDSGWMWHPVGLPAVWELGRWLELDPYESEDGRSRVDVCDRDYGWNAPMLWLDAHTVALGGGGEPGRPDVAVYDVTRTQRRHGHDWCAETARFDGPKGALFSDGWHLFSAGGSGVDVWDPAGGAHLGRIDGIDPTGHDPVTGDFAQPVTGGVRRWRYQRPGGQ